MPRYSISSNVYYYCGTARLISVLLEFVTFVVVELELGAYPIWSILHIAASPPFSLLQLILTRSSSLPERLSVSLFLILATWRGVFPPTALASIRY